MTTTSCAYLSKTFCTFSRTSMECSAATTCSSAATARPMVAASSAPPRVEALASCAAAKRRSSDKLCTPHQTHDTCIDLTGGEAFSTQSMCKNLGLTKKQKIQILVYKQRCQHCCARGSHATFSSHTGPFILTALYPGIGYKPISCPHYVCDNSKGFLRDECLSVIIESGAQQCRRFPWLLQLSCETDVGIGASYTPEFERLSLTSLVPSLQAAAVWPSGEPATHLQLPSPL